MSEVKLNNYLATTSGNISEHDDIMKFRSLVIGTYVVAECIEHIRSMIALMTVASDPSVEGALDQSPFGWSIFRLSDEGKKVVAAADFSPSLVSGPVILADGVAESSVSSMKGCMTVYVAAYNNQIKSITTLCRDNDWVIPSVYSSPLTVGTPVARIGKPTVLDLGTLDALMGRTTMTMSVAWASAKKELVSCGGQANSLAASRANAARTRLAGITKEWNGLVANQCQHAGNVVAERSDVKDLFDLNLKVARDVLGSRVGNADRVARAKGVIAWSRAITYDEWLTGLKAARGATVTSPLSSPGTKTAVIDLGGIKLKSVTPGLYNQEHADDHASCSSGIATSVEKRLTASMESGKISMEKFVEGMECVVANKKKRKATGTSKKSRGLFGSDDSSS